MAKIDYLKNGIDDIISDGLSELIESKFFKPKEFTDNLNVFLKIKEIQQREDLIFILNDIKTILGDKFSKR